MQADGSPLDIAFLVLAAGCSSRFSPGNSKLLSKIGEQTLLELALSKLDTFPGRSVYVAIPESKPSLAKITRGCQQVFTDSTRSGISHSIAQGVKAILQNSPHSHSVMILLGDQPAITPEDITALITKFSQERKTARSAEGVVAAAARYGTPPTYGAPAIFDSSLFGRLCTLEGDRGAKKLLQELNDLRQLALVDMPGAAIDIDTREDLRNYLDSIAN